MFRSLATPALALATIATAPAVAEQFAIAIEQVVSNGLPGPGAGFILLGAWGS